MRMVWILTISLLTILIVVSTVYLSFIKKAKVSSVTNEVAELHHLPVIGSKEKLVEHFNKAMKQHAKLYGVRTMNDMAEMAVESNASAGSADMGATNTPSASETNVQVQGIDEADIVKTDGTYIYEVVLNETSKVQITKAVPEDKMRIESTITYNEDFNPDQLFLHHEQLIVIGHNYENRNTQLNDEDNEDDELATTDMIGILPLDVMTKAIIYDITDRSNPVKTREVAIDGYFSSARLMDGHLYIIANKFPFFEILRENEKIDLRPMYMDTLLDGESQRVAYDDIQYFPESKESNYLMIAAINLGEPKKEAEITTYLGSGGNIYMSKDYLYIAVTDYSSSPRLAIMPADMEYNSEVFKFSIDKTNVSFQHSAKIPGTILNQFSMDEYEGNFRVATTVGQIWNEEKPSDNRLLIFDEEMNKIGELKDLAKGERIYSARFMNERIYIVTFKQTDPLFVIDSSDPTSPKVLGELKIPGFSNYLHPYDENHLIGFGQETIETAGEGSGFKTSGVKISLFDVSDLENPKEKFKEVIGSSWSYSPLNYDHKALLFNKEMKLFAFPVHVFEEIPDAEYEEKDTFQGGYVYELDIEKGFTLKARVTHRDNDKKHDDEWKYHMNRLIYIDDVLYGLSPAKITAYKMDDYHLVGELDID